MLKISFDFDKTTNKVYNMQVIDDTSVTCHVILNNNKIILSDETLNILNVIPGERISIIYFQKNNKLTIPLIAKSDVLGDVENGNKLTKSNTISFKGSQFTLLSEYGNKFKIEPFVEIPDTFKLVSVENINASNIMEETKDVVQIAESENLKENLEDLEETLTFDDFLDINNLPF